MEVIALVKHDCETCATLAPALEAAAIAGAPVRMVSQSNEAETRAFAERVGLATVPELDEGLALSERLDPEAVPAVVLLEGDEEQDRVEGLHRARLEALFAAAGATLPRDGLPEIRPGCASITQEPEIDARIAAKRARAAHGQRARGLDHIPDGCALAFPEHPHDAEFGIRKPRRRWSGHSMFAEHLIL